MASQSHLDSVFGELSPDEGLCLNALELATRGQITDAYTLVEGLTSFAKMQMRQEFALLCAALESASMGTKGRYREAAEKIFPLIGELERSAFRHRLAWLYSTVGFWLGLLGDPERGLEWSERAIVQHESEANSASQFALLSNHGSLLGMLERFEESIPVFLRAVDEQSDIGVNERYVGVHNLAYCWLEWARQSNDLERRQERAINACQMAERAITFGKNSPKYRDAGSAISTLCSALVLSGQFEKAREFLQSALQSNTARPAVKLELMVTMAQASRSLNDLVTATEWLDKAEAFAHQYHLQLGLDRLHELRIAVEEQALRPAVALRYANGYAVFLKARYQRRLKVIAKNADIFVSAERAQWQAELRSQSQIMGEKIAALDRQRSLGQMSAVLGHELNQPLTAIQTSAQTLQRSFAIAGFEVEKQSRMAERIVFNARRAAEIILKIRNFIKPTQSESVAIDFHTVVRGVVEMLSHDALEHRVQVEVIDSHKPAMVVGDAIQLSQVLVNLMRNAFESMASSDRRVLGIAVLPMAAEVLVRIQDSGPGFSEKMLTEAGTPFSTSKSTGLGIGLSISRDILKLHNGTLHIANADSGGALLEIRLPQVEALA